MAEFDYLKPLEQLEVAPFIHETREWLLALQQKSYDKETLKYLVNRHPTDTPYVDFSHEPDQIIQIKNLSNALYLAEQVFEQLPKLNLSSRKSWLGVPQLRDQAEKASHLLLDISQQVGGTFKHEIDKGLSYLAQIQLYTGCGLLKSRIDPRTLTNEKIRSMLKYHVGCIQYKNDIYYFNNKTLKKLTREENTTLKRLMNGLKDGEFQIATEPAVDAITKAIGQSPFMSNFVEPANPLAEVKQQDSISWNAGRLAGHAIDLMHPAAGNADHDLLAWFSGVLPAYIATIRLGIETSAANASIIVPNVDEKKMADVVHKKLDTFSSSIKDIFNTISSIKDPASLITNLPALFMLPAHFKKIEPLLTEISQEVDHLDETVQSLVQEYLAKLKYELLPNLFSLVDKFEINLLLEPGRLSKPLMDQIKPLYEWLIQITKNYPNLKFNDKAEQLLKLEDARFIGLRLDPLHREVDISKQALHQVTLALDVLNHSLDEISNADTYLQSFVLSADAKANMKANFEFLKPYLTRLDDEFKQIGWKAWITSWYKAPDEHGSLVYLKKVKVILEQIKTDQSFRLVRNENLIKSVHEKANLTLFEYKKNNNIFDISEDDAFVHRHSLSDTVKFNEHDKIINSQHLPGNEAWDLYQLYDNKLTHLICAENNCNYLLDALKDNQTVNEKRFKTSKLAFHPDYTPYLLEDKKIQHQPNRLYVNIENGTLNYEVLEQLDITACSLLNMFQVDPQTLTVAQIRGLLGNHDGFIQYLGNVFYFDSVKLIRVHSDQIPRLKPIIDSLPSDKLRIVDKTDPVFADIESDGVRAVCKLYLMHLDKAKDAGYRDCYVWNDEIKQLSYIDPTGLVQEKITLSEQNTTLLIAMVAAKSSPGIKKNELWRLAKEQDSDFSVITPDNPVTDSLTFNVRNIYLTDLDSVKNAGHNDCYVWNQNVLTYVDDHGHEDRVELKRYKKDLDEIAHDGYQLDLMIINSQQACTKQSLARLGLDSRKPTLIKQGNDYWIYGRSNLDTGNWELTKVTASGVDMINALNVNFEGTKSLEVLESSDIYQYLTSIQGHTKLTLSQLVKLIDRKRRADLADKAASKTDDVDYLNLTAQNIATFITPGEGHYRGLIHTGTIPCYELGCELNRLSSVQQIEPFMPRVFDKALERGHIQDKKHTECIKSYSVIQPYLVDAFKDDKGKDIHAFDKDVVNFLSGHVYKAASEPRPSLAFADFKPELRELKTVLSKEKDALMKTRDGYFKQVKNKLLSVEPRPIASVHHQKFSPDVAEFMLSIEPIKRQIHDSNKTLFRVNRALEHLDIYLNESINGNDLLNQPEKNHTSNHYAWFYPYLVQLKEHFATLTPPIMHVTAEQLKTYLKQIRFYEKADIKRNTLIMDSINKRGNHQAPRCDLSERAVFMHLGHHYHEFKPCLMKDSNELDPRQLHIKIAGKYLEYKFLHYGKPQVGKLRLKKLKPALSYYDEKTTLSKETVSNIMSMAYEQRQRQIESDKSLISSEEALDLYQWYRSLQEDQDDSGFQNKLELYEQLAKTKPPEFKIEADIPANYLTRWAVDAYTHVFAHKEDEDDHSEDRTGYLLKNKGFEAGIINFKQSIQTHFDYLADSFKHKLKPAASGLPFPEADTQYEAITNQIIYGASMATPYLKRGVADGVIGFLGMLPEFGVNLTSHAGKKTVTYLVDWYTRAYQPAPKTYSPQQVLVYKRLMNIVYYLEQMASELQKIKKGDDQYKLARLNHLLISYLYTVNIQPQLNALLTDPHFSLFIRDMLSNVESLVKHVTDESQQYSEIKTDDNPVKNLHALKLMNILKMLPERISLTADEYKQKRPALQASAEKAMVNIENLISGYYSSFPYLRLFFDLPVVFGLLNELRDDLVTFANKANKRVKDELDKAPNDKLAKIMREAVSWEITIGLKPGTVLLPLKRILDEFYKGLIAPLVLDADKQVSLLCDPGPVKKLVSTLFQRQLTAHIESRASKRSAKTIQTVLDAYSGSLEQLNGAYKAALPEFKKALNGSMLYIKKPGHPQSDCFVWDEKNSQLFYYDSEGHPNPQTGCDLYLKSVPVGEPITEKILEHNRMTFWTKCGLISMSYDPVLEENKNRLAELTKNKPCYLLFNSKVYFVDDKLIPEELALKTTGPDWSIFPKEKDKKERATKKQLGTIASLTGHTALIDQTYWTVKVKKPTVIKQGDKYFIYEHSADTGWRCTELDPAIMRKMRLDFDKETILHRNSKYQGMYDEITAKTGWTYPIYLKSTHGLLEFISNKIKGRAQVQGQTPDAVYLSENEINKFITSNSNLVMPKRGLSLPNEVGCCLIQMDTPPVNFNHLKLPHDYNAYYVQVKGDDSKLYFINRNDKSITPLQVTLPSPVPVINGRPMDIKTTLPKIRKNKLLIKADFHIIQQLTGHVYHSDFISNLDDFVANRHNKSQLHALAIRCKDHYEALNATSKLEVKAAQEQLDYLKVIEHVQQEGYDLRLMPKSGMLKPGVFYVEELGNKGLQYTVKHSDQGPATTGIINADWFVASGIEFPFPKHKLIKQLTPKMDDILKITSSRGHTLPLNKHIKQSVFIDYFNKKVDDLCNNIGDLQGYTLGFLTEYVDVKSNHLYVNIKDKTLHYKVIDPTGAIKEGNFALGMIGCALEELVSVDQLLPYLPAILKITSQGDRHTRPHSLATEYQAKLRSTLEKERDSIINTAMDSNSKSIDRELNDQKARFNVENLKQYQQLNALNEALDEFRLYLNHAKTQWTTRQSWFESNETLRSKKRTIDHLDALAANNKDDVSVRLKNIQAYLLEDSTLDHLLSYANYESNTFAKLFQLVLRFFEALGMYTPRVVQHVDKIISAIEEPAADVPRQPNRFLFFGETARESIKTREVALKVTVENKNKPNPPEDGSNGPRV